MVRPPGEILATLDDDGALDGLPFMPEMAAVCGTRARVARRVEKTCVEGHWSQRHFPTNDVVILDELRCNGESHDGCKRRCMLFWKEAWLRRVKPGGSALPVDEDELEQLTSRLKVKTDSTHYYCQSTQLSRATEAFPPGYRFGLIPQLVWVAMREIWVGDRSVPEVARLAMHFIQLSLRRRRIGDAVGSLRGPNTRTPTHSLKLQPGERVRIKSKPEIIETLDGNSCNRGLSISVAMTSSYCGREFAVRDRFDRMILETTGEMREVHDTVSLQGAECLCYYFFGSCPRGDLIYWREIWLERLESSAPPPEDPPEPRQ